MSRIARACGFAFLLVFGFWLAYELVPWTTVEKELELVEKDRLAIEEALLRIADESRNIDGAEQPPHRVPMQLAEAPPGFEPAPLTGRSATPPEGYGFVTHHDVKRGPMTEADVDRGPADPTPDWMSSSGLAEVPGRDWTFGWVKLADGSTLEELRAALAGQGGAVIGRSGNLLRARLPSDPSRLQELADSTAVAGIGAVPAEAKMPASLGDRALSGGYDETPVWITLMDDDPEGRWRAALTDLGAVVGYFDPTIRTYAANLPLDALFSVASANFVLAVEAIGRVEPTLEVASAAMDADAVRSYDAATGLFAGIGGATVPVGVMDSGLNVDHRDIGSNRRSICGANFTNFIFGREEDQDLWFDFSGHGTHVAGIAVGNGAVQSNRAGMAPLVQDIRMAKVLSTWGGASALGWGRAMDWFATPTACGDGVPRKALVINSSVGVTHDAWEGRSVVERKIDAAVWGARQLFVTSAGNAVDQGVSSMAGAKNALTVGATGNSGDIAEFSSLGPTYDGRLLPKVVGTGVQVAAPEGEGSRTGYAVLSGTSMASPSVVGVAALAMDAYVVKDQSNVVRDDGTERSLERDEGDTIVLGEIGPDERQTVTGRVSGRQEGSFRLHFAASAWNATAGEASVPVVVGSPGAAAPDAAGAPQNDDFAAAMRLDGVEGETAFDLLHATREPGEPLVRDTPVSPLLSPRSIRYEWQALEDGPVRFSVVPGVRGDYADNVVVGVYRGDTGAGLTPVGTPRFGGGSTFFAEAGTTYRVRLAIHDLSLLKTVPNAFGFGTVTERRSTPVLTLRWAPGDRPANDDFALAAGLEGETGLVLGNNQAATTEPGELMGFTTPMVAGGIGPGKASSVWYRWTAPASGDWRFALDRENLVVAVHSGDRVGESRLVSGVPASEAVFPASAGAEYRISVSSIHAYVSGADFELGWAPGERSDPGSDDVAGAARAFGNFAFVSMDMDALTVEPGEPAESGSRTAWVAWQPPADGRFTWRILRAGFFSTVGEAPLQQSVFEGDTLDALELVAHDEGDETMDQVMAFDVRADATYRLALGLPRDAAEAPLGDQTFILEWGETPSNDDVANAMMLASSGGTYAGSNAFATTEKGEMTGTLGDSSLWWALEPDETGWMRFAAEGLDGLKLAVYRRGEDGTLQLVRAGRTLGEPPACLSSPRPAFAISSAWVPTTGIRTVTEETGWATSNCPGRRPTHRPCCAMSDPSPAATLRRTARWWNWVNSAPRRSTRTAPYSTSYRDWASSCSPAMGRRVN
ncbi:MAG: S8 family serine peptidase [Gammaproteobacteria bacterium]|nr:S8 family serine peptidase [Gammaproteobacteria bacterium]